MEQEVFGTKTSTLMQVWLDGMYMGQPFYVEYETRSNDRKNYDDIF